jgi:hypothetical protein
MAIQIIIFTLRQCIFLGGKNTFLHIFQKSDISFFNIVLQNKFFKTIITLIKIGVSPKN